MTPDSFETRKKYHHSTQHDELPHPIWFWNRSKGQLAEIRGLRKTLITLEWKKLERSALRRSKENNFLYRMVTFGFKIDQKMCQIFDCENVQRALTWLVDCRPIKFWAISMCPGVLFQMVKTAGLYLVPSKSYSKNSHTHGLFWRTIVQSKK